MQAVTMKLLCLALMSGVFSSLTADGGEPPPHAFDAGWQGVKTCELLYETPAVRVAKCTFPPGVGHERHFHNPHFGYVLEGGTMLVTDASGEQDFIAEAGATWSTSERTVHQGVNVGDTTTSYLMVEPRVTAGGPP